MAFIRVCIDWFLSFTLRVMNLFKSSLRGSHNTIVDLYVLFERKYEIKPDYDFLLKKLRNRCFAKRAIWLQL